MAELVKFGAFSLVDYEKVLVSSRHLRGPAYLSQCRSYLMIVSQILDADAVILKNMDELFDSPKEVTCVTVPAPAGRAQSVRFDLGMLAACLRRYAYDFLVGAPNGCIQGGFVMIKPSIRTMHQFLGLIREGDWGKDGGMGGWGDTSIG